MSTETIIYIDEAKQKKTFDHDSKEFHKEFLDSEEEVLKALDDKFGSLNVESKPKKK